MLRADRDGVAPRLPLDAPVVEAIATHRAPDAHRIAGAADRGVLQDSALRRGGADVPRARGARLLEPITPEIQRGAKNEALWDGLAALDAYRRGSRAAPATLSNPVLLGTLLMPLGLMPRHGAPARRAGEREESTEADAGDRPVAPPTSGGRSSAGPPKEPILKIGMLPIARGDTERLRQMLSLQRGIADLEMSPRAKRALMHRGPFEDALTWFEIHGNAPAVLEHWKGFIEALGDEAPASAAPTAKADAPPARRRAADAPPRPPTARAAGGFRARPRAAG